MNFFSKNLKHLRLLKGLTQETIAEDCQLSRSKISSYEEGRANPPIDALVVFSSYFKIPIDVLIKKDLSLTQDKSFIEIGNQRILFPIMVTDSNENLIEVVPIKTSAGYLNGYDDPEYIEQLSKMKLPFIPTGKHRAFPIEGDSMLPLKDGSFVVARFVEDIKDIQNGSTYVVVTLNDGMTYKRVYDKGDTILLKPDNRAYTEYEVPKNEIVELWEFSCSINTQEYDQHELKISSIVQMFNELRIELEAFNGLLKN